MSQTVMQKGTVHKQGYFINENWRASFYFGKNGFIFIKTGHIQTAKLSNLLQKRI